MNKLRIGFLSTAGIGKKNWKAILNSGNCVVSAVASRDVVKSREFIDHCQKENAFEVVPEALGSYEALLASKNVDAVYIPLPTGLRKEFVLQAAAAGKHVLCEKPCASSVEELREMLAACKKHSVQFLDGVMFMHSPRLDKVREILDDGQSVGQIRRIASAFSFYPGEEFFDKNIRADGALEPTGCLGDLGWYSIRFALWAFKWQLPEAVSGRILSQSKQLPGRVSSPTEFSAELFYPGGVSVQFYSSFLAAKQQWVHVSGQKGWLLLPDFVHPYDSYEPGIQVNEKNVAVAGEVKCPPGVDPMMQSHATAQDTRMFRNFANQIRSGKLNEDWTMWAMKTQQVLDACHKAGQRGVTVKIA
ncbi:MAG TPA: Gfo/Idh/MocA family oxidoreductase [Verrucomicrobiae bacterium]|nr:Gfo/Idh/MocA family oxidoreductase [Verrucomicrobiae bacterium]